MAVFQAVRIVITMPIRLLNKMLLWFICTHPPGCPHGTLYRQPYIGRCLHPCGDLQHAVESHYRPEPAVESKHELVEIALQVLRLDPLVRSQEPCIKVPEDDVNNGEVLVHLGVMFNNRIGMVITL
ncbi:hypothetical protein ES703_85898 [subsurface metagenome]